jgi:hypothetical protein
MGIDGNSRLPDLQIAVSEKYEVHHHVGANHI